MEETNKKVPVWEQLFIAVTKAGKLMGFSEIKVSRFIGYIVFFSFLIGLITIVVPTTATVASFHGFKTLFGETLPKFELVNGEIKTETDKEVKLYIAGMNVVFNTKENTCPREELTASGIYMTFGKKNIQMFIATGSEQIEFYNIEAKLLFPDGLNNEMLVQMVPYLYVSFIITFLFMLIGITFKYLVSAMLYSIAVFAFAQKSAYPLNMGNALRLAFYAQTLGVLISNINRAFGYLLPSGLIFVVGFMITIFKIGAALKFQNSFED